MEVVLKVVVALPLFVEVVVLVVDVFVVVVSIFFVEDFIEATFVEVVVLVLLKIVVVVVDVIVVLVSVEKKVSCEPLNQTEIDSSVTPKSALFSW